VIVAVSFVTLAVLALAGAGGLLVYRRVQHCVRSFLTCAAALAGLFALLNLGYLAAVQVAIHAGLVSLLLLALPLAPNQMAGRRSPWLLVAAVPFLAVTIWGIIAGTLGEPVLALPPVWAARGNAVSTLGQQFGAGYLVPFALAGLLIVVCVVSAAYMLHTRQSPEKERE
jgi:NADH-quinone oxidoreductase subunit J